MLRNKTGCIIHLQNSEEEEDWLFIINSRSWTTSKNKYKMQSPENVESNKSRHSNSNSKLHTPCRQIGLRRKKPRTSDTPIKENNSPVIRTSDTPMKDNNSPVIRTSDTPMKDNNSPVVRTLDTPTKENNSPVVRTSDTPIKENNSPKLKTDASVKQNELTPTTPTLLNVSDESASVDKNQTKETCRLQKAIENKKLTPAVLINSGNSQDVRKEVEAVKKRIKEKEEKIAALRLAKLYRKKHDTSTLSELTERWREGCQNALQELLSTSTTHGYQVNMSKLISQLGIPFQLVRYNPDLEDFE